MSELQFDQSHYQSLNSSRGDVIAEALRQLRPALKLETAVDVGCGIGHFSGVLDNTGFRVTGVEGRASNVEEARRRHPGVTFHNLNVEGEKIRSLGKFDLVLCLGLLYHLENPFQAVRNLCALTGKLMLAEGVCYPHGEPVLGLVDEPKVEDQGLNYVAFYPSESCLIKMVYRSGFSHVYRFRKMPDHPDFRRVKNSFQVRTMLAASFAPLQAEDLLELMPEPISSIRPWINLSTNRPPGALERLGRFSKKPFPEKIATLRRIAGFEKT